MEFLPQQNRRWRGDTIDSAADILATGKARSYYRRGLTTGADCLGTSHPAEAAFRTSFEIMPMPPPERSPQTPWPMWRAVAR